MRFKFELIGTDAIEQLRNRKFRVSIVKNDEIASIPNGFDIGILSMPIDKPITFSNTVNQQWYRKAIEWYRVSVEATALKNAYKLRYETTRTRTTHAIQNRSM